MMMMMMMTTMTTTTTTVTTTMLLLKIEHEYTNKDQNKIQKNAHVHVQLDRSTGGGDRFGVYGDEKIDSLKFTP